MTESSFAHRGRRRVTSVLAAAVLALLLVLGTASGASAQDAEDDRRTLAVTEIDLAASTAVITNRGEAEVDANGIILCNFPQYGQVVGADPIPPGGSITVDTTASGVTLDAGSGELGLYLSQAFDDRSQIVSYVEWGEPGHQRSAVAIRAGIWAEGAVDPAGATVITASSTNPVSPDEWAAAGTEATADDEAEADGELADTGIESGLAVVVGVTPIVAGVMILTLRRRLAGLR